MELRDALPKFRAAGTRLYAISYDEPEALAAFAETYGIDYPLLSDVDSAVIRRFGILNTEIPPGNLPAYGVPYPGTYVTDESGRVVAKFFHDSYKKRDSPENLIDAALGRIVMDPATPSVSRGGDDVRVTTFVQGGRGTIRQGLVRRLVVRFEPADGLHLYGEPVPEGMIATRVEVSGPEGLVTLPPLLPPTRPLRLAGTDLTLHVWDGAFDVAVPFYPRAELVSECRPLDHDSVPIDVTVHYQACDDTTCLLPRTETFRLDVGLEPVEMPNLAFHGDTGQRVSEMDGAPHLRRLIRRQLRRHPLGVLRSILQMIRLNLAGRRRQRASDAGSG